MTGALLSLLLRKCKLVTSGPWLEVTSVALRDVSIIPESPGAHGSGLNIALWAISDKGDVLCRLGVSELNPEVGTRWGNPGSAQPASTLRARADSYRDAPPPWSRAGLWPPRACPGGSLGPADTARGPRGSLGLRALGAEVEVGLRSRPPWGRAGDRRDRAALSVPPLPQGFCWMHVGTDQPFTSVSIGACYQVWAVAKDGSAFYRSSVSPSRPNGESPRLRRTPCARAAAMLCRAPAGGYGYFRFRGKPVDGSPFN